MIITNRYNYSILQLFSEGYLLLFNNQKNTIFTCILHCFKHICFIHILPTNVLNLCIKHVLNKLFKNSVPWNNEPKMHIVVKK